MPKTLRQPRHSLLASSPRVRALLLCGMAMGSSACPAVVDLDNPEEDRPDVSIVDNFFQADAARESSDDTAGAGARPPLDAGEPADEGGRAPTPPDQSTRCLPAPPSQAIADAGATDARGGELSISSDPLGALRAVLAAGYFLPCGAEQTHVLQVPNGLELSVLGRSGLCAPFEIMLYRLRVSKSGQITILSAVAASAAQLQCDAGEPEPASETLAPPLACAGGARDHDLSINGGVPCAAASALLVRAPARASPRWC